MYLLDNDDSKEYNIKRLQKRQLKGNAFKLFYIVFALIKGDCFMPEVQLTEAGRKELEARLEYLKSVRRAEVAEEIKTARGFGDLSENAEYDAARKAQAEMEGEIAEIEAQLRLAKIIHETTVTCAEITESNEQLASKTYTIVGTAEADLSRGRISDESPIGSALIRSKQGDIVEVPLPSGRIKRLKVLRVVK